MNPNAILMHLGDNVAVSTCPIPAGEQARLSGLTLTVNQDIPRGHKLAVKDIGPGEAIKKYGEPIGIAKTDIRSGDHVHVHNLDTGGQ